MLAAQYTPTLRSTRVLPDYYFKVSNLKKLNLKSTQNILKSCLHFLSAYPNLKVFLSSFKRLKRQVRSILFSGLESAAAGGTVFKPLSGTSQVDNDCK